MNTKLPFYRSLRFRLSFMIGVVIFMVIGATAVLSAMHSFEREVIQKRELLAAAASGHAAAVSGAVAQGSRQSALSALRGIRDLPDVVQADIRLENGQIFTQLGTAAILIRKGEQNNNLNHTNIWSMRQLRIQIPIIHNGEQIGRLRMLADISNLRESIFHQFRLTALTSFLALFLGALIAHHMISRATRPLHKLAVQMANFAEDSTADYETISAGNDETGVLATAFNEMVSSIKVRDQKLAHHMEALEDTVKERTHDLHTAKEAAEAANAAKSDFLATMSHEIRTPMNGMLVMAEMLSAADLSKRHRRYAEIIARSGNSLLTIINDILDMSKIESGKLELEPCTVSIDTLVSDVTALFWERAREQGVELTSFVSSRVPAEISVDPTRLNQIITNLVNNALKFTEVGSVQIRVDAKESQTNTAVNLVIEVEDTGIGIPEDKIETIFETFSQADQSTTRCFGGTGLGLAVCRKLADAMGGKVSATSQPGKGSVFRLELEAPIVTPPPAFGEHAIKVGVDIEASATADALTQLLTEADCYASIEQADINITTSQMLSSAPEAFDRPTIILSDIGDALAGEMLRSGRAVDLLPNPFTRQDVNKLLMLAEAKAYRGVAALDSEDKAALPSFVNLRVLAADDNAVNREILREALSALNVSIDFAENGLQAVEMAKSASYDAIFMDGSMPKMDGFEATRAICEYWHDEQQPPVPIIALTAQVAGVTQEAWREAGAKHYIAKPFTLQRLGAVLSALGHAEPTETMLSNAAPEGSIVPLLNMETIGGLDALGASSGRDLRSRVWSLFRIKAPEGIDALVSLSEEEASRTEIARQAHAVKSMALSSGVERLASTCEQIETAAKQDTTWPDICNLVTVARADLHQSIELMDKKDAQDKAAA